MKSWAFLVLAASVSAIPLDIPAGRLHKRAPARQHIGYRVVSKVRPPTPYPLRSPPATNYPIQNEADAIHANGGKAVQSVGSMGRQLGPGTYISPRFQGFPEYDPSKGIPWDCVVTVDADVWDGWKKAWVPRLFEFPEDRENNPDKCKPLILWTPRWRANRARFLTFLDEGLTPDNTVLFSKMAGHEEKTQPLIPPPIIDTGEVYLAQCAERETEANTQIGEMGTVDWGVENMPGWGLGSDAA
ncbi:uncharacterized protein DSM5745_05175 [Aspergillus mulundensis]|uniref:Uncharacterized protein n=1 Tax=Aspergillus mulundensis TaxID=1810919 RepID=A0A3D8S5R4_9EURO|nr:hypothetical protein DSM5745_05175 [Aspergillus mulundensis]RDW81618.1 hypothetical protein DSM5745_05175 [Aspergillus mulundensis]